MTDTIKPGDSVASNGRISTLQDGRRRYIEFETGLVTEADGNLITVNPEGMHAEVICQFKDLLVGSQREPKGHVPAQSMQRTQTKLSGLHIAGKVEEEHTVKPPAKKAAPRRRPSSTKPGARRRRTT
jgi:hypothetical protein